MSSLSLHGYLTWISAVVFRVRGPQGSSRGLGVVTDARIYDRQDKDDQRLGVDGAL